jgi:hypothetical protein
MMPAKASLRVALIMDSEHSLLSLRDPAADFEGDCDGALLKFEKLRIQYGPFSN